MCEEKQPNLRDIWRNLRQPMPLHRKIGLVFTNNLRKIIHRRNCCGHPGEPGC